MFNFSTLLSAGQKTDGSLEKRLLLGRTLLGPVVLEHGLSATADQPPQSEWQLPMMFSYFAPEGRSDYRWVMPGGQQHRFKKWQLKKSKPKVFEEEWVPVRGTQPEQFRIHGRDGRSFLYDRGQLKEIALPDGRVFEVRSNGPRITRIQQRGAEHPMLHATYDDQGRPLQLQIGQLGFSFVLSPISGQLTELRPATSAKPIHFTYNAGLLTQLSMPDGSLESFGWRTDLKGYEKLSGLKLPDEEPKALLERDDQYQYFWGISRKGIHLVSIDAAGKRQETILNPHTNELVQIDRNRGELMLFYALERENGAGKLTEVRAPDGRKLLENRYDKRHNLVYQKEAGKPAVVFTYDDQNRLLSQGRPGQKQIVYVYKEEFRQPSQIRNIFGHEVNIEVDEHDRITAFKDLNGGLHRFAYDALGRLTARQYPLGFQERWSFDAYGNLIEHLDLEGQRQQFTYDQHGRLVGSSDGRDLIRRSYNDIGSLSEVFRGEDLIHKVETHVTAGGRVVQSIDELGRKVEQEFDIMGRILRQENALGEEISYRYNRSGDLLGWTDDRGVSATLLRDEAGRVGAVLNDMGQQDVRKYNQAGLLRQRKTGEQEVRYNYDREGRLVKTDYGKGQVVTHRYDEADRLVESTAGEVSTRYAYDLLDRVVQIQEQLPGGIQMTVGYRYTPGGQKAAVRLTKTHNGELQTDVTTTYTHDELGRVTAVFVNDEKKVVYGYQPERLQVATKWYANGIRQEYSYDPEGRPAKVAAYRGEDLLRGIAYRWNKQGQLIEREIYTGEGVK